jgi:hypothetical protein
MKTPTGFDRISTPEELHQVLAVLNDLALGTWGMPGNGGDAKAWILCADPTQDDLIETESLAEFFMDRPEFKN